MSAFRTYSNRYAFRERAETPEIAVELSLQPWRAFAVDAVIMFADILTPLPAMGLDYQIIPGKGPCIEPSVRSTEELARVQRLTVEAAEASLPFVGATLSELARQLATARPRPALLGFLGAPFTLAAYAIDGQGGRASAGRHVKRMMYSMEGQELLHRLLDVMTDSMVAYAVYQAHKGAEAIQIFDSWAHLLSPEDYCELSLPYIEKMVQGIRAAGVKVPLILFANGSCGKLDPLGTIFPDGTASFPNARGLDALALDWKTSIAEARRLYGPQAVLQGNIDPMVLAYGEPAQVSAAIDRCVRSAAGGGHILNLGHGVMQDTPEVMVAHFCNHARALSDADWYQDLRAMHLEKHGMPQ
jgi:uroporphyrinogen decarboxylase